MITKQAVHAEKFNLHNDFVLVCSKSNILNINNTNYIIKEFDSKKSKNNYFWNKPIIVITYSYCS